MKFGDGSVLVTYEHAESEILHSVLVQGDVPDTRAGRIELLNENVQSLVKRHTHVSLLEREIIQSDEMLRWYIKVIETKALANEIELRLIQQGMLNASDPKSIATVVNIDDFRSAYCKRTSE